MNTNKELDITILKNWDNGVTYVEALKFIQGKQLLTNKQADAILQNAGQFMVFTISNVNVDCLN